MESRRLEKRLKERFVKAMATYRLIDDDDKILVGLSGGKDSLLLTELLAKRANILHPRFEVEAVHVRMENIHYESDYDYLQQFCDKLGVRLHIVTTRFDTTPTSETTHDVQTSTVAIAHAFSDMQTAPQSPQLDSAVEHRQKQPCFLCSWMRRKQLFSLAQKLGFNKIALGHHQDDIIHTALMNLFFQGRFDTMPARLKLRKMPLTIIRPLCMIQEDDIKAYAEMQGYQKQIKRCPYETDSHRIEIKGLFETIQQINKESRYSIWRAIVSGNILIQE